MPHRAVTVASALLALLVLAPACGGGSRAGSNAAATTTQPPNPFGSAGSSSSDGASTHPVGQPRGSLTIGDCFNWQRFVAGAPIDPADIELQVCTGPHQYEIYEAANHPAGEGAAFPGDDQLEAFADDRCLAAFSPYVGTPYEKSSLDYAVVRPSESSWRTGDRQVACALHDADYLLLSASMRGSAK